MDDLLHSNSELVIKHLYDSQAHNEDTELNPFSLTDINSDYYDVSNLLPDKCRHDNFLYKVLHLNIQSLSAKYDNFKLYYQTIRKQVFKFLCYYGKPL